MDRLTILESNSVAGTVKQLSIEIGALLKRAIFANTTVNGTRNGIFFKEGNFEFNSKSLGDIIMIVKYKVYIFENEQERNVNTRFLTDLGGECDFEKRYIRICTYLVDNQLPNNFYATFQHEMQHFYQNFMGGGKRDESLYQTIIRLCKNTKNCVEQSVGQLMYRCFPHEQDAMANEFYGYLMQNKKDERLKDYEYARQLSQYKPFDMSFDAVIVYAESSDYRREFLKVVNNDLHMSEDQFFDYVNKQEKRFIKKLENAYRAFLEDADNLTYESKDYFSNFYRLSGTPIKNNFTFIFS